MLSLMPRPVQSPARMTGPDPFIFSVDLVRRLQLVEFAHRVLTAAAHLTQPKRLPSVGGHPDTYSEVAILVTIMIMAIWHLSPRQMVNRLRRWPVLAKTCGYPSGRVISASQLYRRRDRLGLWVYFVTFISLVWLLVRRGVILGYDLVLDSTIIEAFSRLDLEAAWSFAKKFGFKVHMVICRHSFLPLMFLVTPANRNDAPWAVPLLELVRRWFRLPIQVVRADAAYFTKAIIGYILWVLKAQPIIDFNPRRAGKKFVVTMSYIAWWRRSRGKRGYIERFFALLKRYYGLNNVQVMGLQKVWRHTFEVCIAVLIVAWLATELGRPDLMHSKARLLAPC